MSNNARNDLIAHCKIIGMACDDCALYLNISLERVWLYWRLINIHVYQGINNSEDLKIKRTIKPITMNIKQLKAAIADLPDDMDVMLDSNPEEGLYGMSETAKVLKVEWRDDDIPEEEWVTNDCLVISDEM